MSKILLIEDEAKIAQSLEFPVHMTLGHELVHCLTLEEAKAVFDDKIFDAVLLDLNLPDGNGIDFCKKIREKSSIPILIITARRDEVDRILGLELGADDYIIKPFSPREVVARINAVLRRRSWERGKDKEVILSHCGIKIDETKREVTVNDSVINLTRTEYKLLLAMMRHPGQVYSREIIVEIVWDGIIIVDRVVDSVVSRIRRKLGKMADGKSRIRTVHGIGYAMSTCDHIEK